jgi:hypothetical protein
MKINLFYLYLNLLLLLEMLLLQLGLLEEWLKGLVK